jgi:hypothetical protein
VLIWGNNQNQMEDGMMNYYTTVAELKAHLDKLDPTYELECNAVGNLRIGLPDGTMIGYIEMRPGGELSILTPATDEHQEQG